MARNGWNTVDEYEALSGSGYDPEIIVLSYFVNDISHAAAEAGLEFSRPVAAPGGLAGFVIQKSNLVNFLYWRFYRSRNAGEIAAYRPLYLHAYQTESVWKIHQRELLDIVDHATSKQARLIVVVFPSLADPSLSHYAKTKVVDFLRQHDVDVIDLEKAIAGREPSEFIVNTQDTHPNARFHREVGNLLFERVAAEN
jgi:hypothetical protein